MTKKSTSCALVLLAPDPPKHTNSSSFEFIGGGQGGLPCSVWHCGTPRSSPHAPPCRRVGAKKLGVCGHSGSFLAGILMKKTKYTVKQFVFSFHQWYFFSPKAFHGTNPPDSVRTMMSQKVVSLCLGQKTSGKIYI